MQWVRLQMLWSRVRVIAFVKAHMVSRFQHRIENLVRDFQIVRRKIRSRHELKTCQESDYSSRPETLDLPDGSSERSSEVFLSRFDDPRGG